MTMTENNLVANDPRSTEYSVGIVCVNVDPASRNKLDSLVARMPGTRVVDNVDGRVSPREVITLLEPFQHRVCLVDFDDEEESSRFSQGLHDSCNGSLNIFAAATDSSPAHIIRTMRSGCSEFLVKPFQSDQVFDALEHVQTRRPSTLLTQKGQVITVMGAKGGTGVTSLALHLALNLVQRHQQKCLLVDEHPSLGDVSLYLGLTRHQYSFYELVHNTDRLDTDLLHGFLLQHSSGLDVLDSPEAIHEFPNASPQAIEHTLAFLAENYQFVVLDCPPGLTEDTCAAIRQSDRVAIIMTPELPAINNAIRAVKYLTGVHYPEDKIDIVLNRHSKKSSLTDAEIEEALHRSITVKIPNSYDQIVNAINGGTPIEVGNKSALFAAFGSWADRLVGPESTVPAAGKVSRGLFSMFLS